MRSRRRSEATTTRVESGQALVEFSLAITIFLLLIMGIIDLAGAAYQYNGVSEAARELARVTSVYALSDLGSSPESQAVLSTQRKLVPGLGTPTYTCIDIAGTPIEGLCPGGGWVRVTISATFRPATPLTGFLGTIVLTSSASAQVQ